MLIFYMYLYLNDCKNDNFQMKTYEFGLVHKGKIILQLK